MPPIGGDTLFADSHAAFRGLPETLQETLLPLSGVHDYRYFLSALDPIQDAALIEEIKSRIPFGVSHPLVRQHPETGKPALYIHGGFLRHESLFNRETGEAMGEAASLALSKMLLAQHARPELMCRFAWQPGSIAFWDNRAVQHYAASDYYPHTRSIRRVTISGHITHIHVMSNGWKALLTLMKGELVTPKINIDPPAGFSVSGRAPQHISIEREGRLNISRGDSQMNGARHIFRPIDFPRD